MHTAAARYLNGCSHKKNQQGKESKMKKEVLIYNKLTYVISYPENFNEDAKYPVILHLHGAGTRGEIQQHGRPAL